MYVTYLPFYGWTGQEGQDFITLPRLCPVVGRTTLRCLPRAFYVPRCAAFVAYVRPVVPTRRLLTCVRRLTATVWTTISLPLFPRCSSSPADRMTLRSFLPHYPTATRYHTQHTTAPTLPLRSGGWFIRLQHYTRFGLPPWVLWFGSSAFTLPPTHLPTHGLIAAALPLPVATADRRFRVDVTRAFALPTVRYQRRALIARPPAAACRSATRCPFCGLLTATLPHLLQHAKRDGWRATMLSAPGRCLPVT